MDGFFAGEVLRMDILDRGDNEKGLIIGARYLGLVVRSAVMDYPKITGNQTVTPLNEVKYSRLKFDGVALKSGRVYVCVLQISSQKKTIKAALLLWSVG